MPGRIATHYAHIADHKGNWKKYPISYQNGSDTRLILRSASLPVFSTNLLG